MVDDAVSDTLLKSENLDLCLGLGSEAPSNMAPINSGSSASGFSFVEVVADADLSSSCGFGKHLRTTTSISPKYSALRGAVVSATTSAQTPSQKRSEGHTNSSFRKVPGLSLKTPIKSLIFSLPKSKVDLRILLIRSLSWHA